MIGKQIRGGFNSIWRITSNAPKIVLYKENCEMRFVIGHMVGIISDDEKRLLLYNADNLGYDDELDSELLSLYPMGRKIMSQYEYDSLYIMTSSDENIECYLLPEDFYEKYQLFFTQNKKLIKGLQHKYMEYNMHNIYSYLSYIYSDGSKNFYEWAINLFLNYHIQPWLIKFVLWFNKEYHQLISQLKLHTITAYNNRELFQQLLNELQDVRNARRVNVSINMFNTAQKRILQHYKNSHPHDDKFYHSLVQFSKLSSIKKKNLIQKVSTINDADELVEQLNLATAQLFKWDYDNFMMYISQIERLNYRIVSNKNKIVVLQVFDYETIKYLCKATNWCISKNKSYWNNYIRQVGKYNDAQFVIFNFNSHEDDLDSVIGITIRNGQISAAHDYRNHQLIFDTPLADAAEFETMYINYDALEPLGKILKKVNLCKNFFVEQVIQKSDISIESILNEIYSIIPQEDTEQLVSDGENIVLRTKNSDILQMFNGNRLHEFITSERILYDNDIEIFYTLFINLHCRYDKVLCAASINRSCFIINTIGYDIGENMMGLCVENNIVAKDMSKIIPNFDISALMYTLCSETKLRLLRELCALDSTWKQLKKTEPRLLNRIISHILTISTRYLTFDGINLFYKNNQKLLKYISYESFAFHCGSLIEKMIETACDCNLTQITQEDIDSLYNHQLQQNVSKAKTVFLFELLKKILTYEVQDMKMSSDSSQRIYAVLASYAQTYPNTFVEQFLSLIPHYKTI